MNLNPFKGLMVCLDQIKKALQVIASNSEQGKAKSMSNDTDDEIIVGDIKISRHDVGSLIELL